MSVAPLRVAVVSQFQLVREGLAVFLDSAPERVVLTDVAASDGHLAGLDVVVYDLAGIGSGPDDLLHLLHGSAAVLGLTRDGRGDLTDGARALGLQCFVAEHDSAVAILNAVEAAGGRSRHPPRNPGMVLTGREMDVLRLVASGRSNPQIAAEMFISLNTVKTYIRGAYSKIGVLNRPGAVIWCNKYGLGDD